VDEAGNLFWIETLRRSPGEVGVTAKLVSVNHEGEQRFRVQLAESDRAIHVYATPLLAPGLVVVVSGLLDESCDAGARVEARDAADGHLVWSRSLGPWVVEASAEGMCTNSIPGTAALAGNQLVVTARACTPTRCDNALIALALSSGERLWTRTTGSGRDRPDEGLVVDEHGNIFVSTQSRLAGGGYGEAALLSLSPEGALRFQVRFQEFFRVDAVGSGRVFVTTGGGSSSPAQVFDADSGVRVQSWDAWLRAPVITYCDVFTLDGFDITAQRLQRRDGTWGEPSWDVLLAEPLSDYGKAGTAIPWPILTRHGSLLFTTQEWSVQDSSEDERPAFLHEVDAAGAEVLRVALPRGRYHGASALRRGRWVVAATVGGRSMVRAFDLPDRDAADVGWVTERGGMARDGRAR
jgi:outer membrane protein assembly factor BamB